MVSAGGVYLTRDHSAHQLMKRGLVIDMPAAEYNRLMEGLVTDDADILLGQGVMFEADPRVHQVTYDADADNQYFLVPSEFIIARLTVSAS